MSIESKFSLRRMENSLGVYPRRMKPQTTCVESKPTDFETYEEYVREFQETGRAVRLSEAMFCAAKQKTK